MNVGSKNKGHRMPTSVAGIKGGGKHYIGNKIGGNLVLLGDPGKRGSGVG